MPWIQRLELFQSSVLLAGVAVFGLGCATGHCPSRYQSQNNDLEQRQEDGQQLKRTFKTQPGGDAAPIARVKVYKADGSLQCAQGKPIPLELMEKQLQGIKVYDRYSDNDGKIRATVCGNSTGQINVYEIDSDNLQQAETAGFKKLGQ